MTFNILKSAKKREVNSRAFQITHESFSGTDALTLFTLEANIYVKNVYLIVSELFQDDMTLNFGTSAGPSVTLATGTTINNFVMASNFYSGDSDKAVLITPGAANTSGSAIILLDVIEVETSTLDFNKQVHTSALSNGVS